MRYSLKKQSVTKSGPTVNELKNARKVPHTFLTCIQTDNLKVL